MLTGAYLETVILVSVSSMTRLIVLPPLPMIRPIRLLCARIFSEISLSKRMNESKSRPGEKTEISSSGVVLDLPLVGVIGFLLHHFQNTTAGVGAVLRIAVNGNGFFQGADILLPMNIHPT
jgi:hypothetical protein